MTTFFSHVYLDGQRLRVSPPAGVPLSMFNAIGDGVAGSDSAPATGTDDTAAFQSALNWLAAQGGGTLELGPYRYMIDLPGNTQLAANLSNVTIKGVPGKTVLDFSRTTGFYNGSAGMDGVVRPNGFIATSGSKHDGATANAAILLTNDTIAPVGAVGRVNAGARSGTTVTLTLDVPHGLAIGNLVWSLGEANITGDPVDDGEGGITNSQMCFYTVGGRSLGRTIPVAVTSLPTTTSFSFEYTSSLTGQDTVMVIDGDPYVFHASDVISVPDSSKFSRGERVLVGSLRERGRDNEHCNIGEYQIIGRILSPTLIRFHGDVRETYAVADGARVFKLSQISNVTFDGISFVGKGYNPATYYDPGGGALVIQRGDTCLSLSYTHGLRIRNCRFTDCDLMSAYIFYASDALIEDNVIVQDQRDAAGATTGVIDIQYGFNFGAAVDDITFRRNTVYGGRHAIVQGGSIVDSDFGVARQVRILDNYCVGQWLESISTHQGADNLTFSGNQITGSRGGINPRYCKNVVMTGNTVVCKYYGVILYNDVVDALIANNVFDAGSYPVWIRHIDNPTASVINTGGKLSGPFPAGPSIQISSNQIRGGLNGIYCIDTTAGLTVAGIEITDNSIWRSRAEAIRVAIGDLTQAADGWTGSISGNRLYGCCVTGAAYQMRLANAKGVTVNGNSLFGTSAFANVFLIEGDGTTGCDFMANRIPATLYSSAVFAYSAMKGSGHRTDATLREDVTISGGVAALKFTTTRHLRLRMESGSADDLDTIAGAGIDQELTLSTQATGWVITVKHGGGFELDANTDKLLNAGMDRLRVMWSTADGKWLQTAPLMDHA